MNYSFHMSVEQNGSPNEEYKFLLAVSLLAIVANGMVVEVIRRKGNSRKTNDLFIVTLAVSDFLYGLCTLTYILYSKFLKAPPTATYCKILSPFHTVIYFVSVLTLVSMAIERQYVILNPFKTGIRKKWRRLWFFMIWFLSTVFVVPFFIVAKATKESCTESWPSHAHRQVYTAVLFTLQFPLPLFIIIVCYAKIGIFLARYTPPGETCRATNQPDMRAVSQRKTTLRVTKLVATIIILFVLMKLPPQLGWMILDFGDSEDEKLAFSLINVGLFSTAVHSFTNALVYGILIKQFRKELIKILYTLWTLCRVQRRSSLGKSKNLRGTEELKQNQIQLQSFANLGLDKESFTN